MVELLIKDRLLQTIIPLANAITKSGQKNNVVGDNKSYGQDNR